MDTSDTTPHTAPLQENNMNSINIVDTKKKAPILDQDSNEETGIEETKRVNSENEAPVQEAALFDQKTDTISSTRTELDEIGDISMKNSRNKRLIDSDSEEEQSENIPPTEDQISEECFENMSETTVFVKKNKKFALIDSDSEEENGSAPLSKTILNEFRENTEANCEKNDFLTSTKKNKKYAIIDSDSEEESGPPNEEEPVYNTNSRGELVIERFSFKVSQK